MIVYLLGHQKGKHKEQVKTMKGTLENVQKAKTIRDNVVDIDRIRRLHDKYIANIDIGHTTPITTYPVGGEIEIDISKKEPILRVLKH